MNARATQVASDHYAAFVHLSRRYMNWFPDDEDLAVSLGHEILCRAAEDWVRDGEPCSFYTYLRYAMRYRVIDEWRTRNKSRNGGKPTVLSLDYIDCHRRSIFSETVVVAHRDRYNEYDWSNVPFTDREKYIIRRLGEGAKKVRISEELRLSNGRISQILRDIRRKVIKTRGEVILE